MRFLSSGLLNTREQEEHRTVSLSGSSETLSFFRQDVSFPFFFFFGLFFFFFDPTERSCSLLVSRVTRKLVVK